MSDPAAFFPFFLFSFLMTVTPGPNNTMALVSGARVGILRSAPLVCGIAAGVALQLVAIGLGLDALFEAYPSSHDAMRIGGSLYLTWLAYQVARSGSIPIDGDARPPLGFVAAAAFQWINPKAWAITTSAAAAYIPHDDYIANVSVAAVLIAIIALPCVGLWVAAGRLLRSLLAHPSYARRFNLTVAALLLATMLPIILDLGKR